MNKILLIAPKYSVNSNDKYLTNDIVDNLRSRGATVKVIAFNDNPKSNVNENIIDKIIYIKSKFKYIKYFFVWNILIKETYKLILEANNFNQIIMFGPLIIMWPAAYLLRFIKSPKKTVFVFDFFPIHQVQIKALPLIFEKMCKFIENKLLNNFNEIILMGKRNKIFAENYYPACAGKKIKVINLWGTNTTCLHSKPYESGAIRVVFGGQMIKGRKIDKLICVLDKLRSNNINIEIDFYSSGTYFNYLKNEYVGQKWIRFLDTISRQDYKNILSKFHVGVIVTDPLAKVPAFPSKVIDYIQAGLFVLAIVEKESEFVDVFNNFERVKINHFQFDSSNIIDLIKWFELVKVDANKFEVEILENIFNINNAVDILMSK